MRRLLISAAHKSSGKTTLSVGLAAALSARGLQVQPFKKGPDYIDPMWLAKATGRPCFNLDPYLTPAEALRRSFAADAQGADLALVEGNKGLYDGMDLDGSNSNAALARLLGLPVLLVVDARGMTRGVAPLLLGYQAFDRALHIAGVVLNRVGGARHEAKLRAAIAHYTDIPVLGAVAEDPRLAVQERHLGLMPCNELGGARQQVQAMGQIIGAQVDLSAVCRLAAGAAPWAAAARPAAPTRAGTGGEVRIGIARDRAFGFYYPDDLAALEAAGAKLIPINTLRDSTLPPLDGLFIGGGFPEACMDELSANGALRAALHQAIAGGLPTYAECGGLMYLSRSITFKGRGLPMVGAIAADAVMQPRPVGRGYVHLQATAHHPWAEDGEALRGHEFHHSALVNLAPELAMAYRVTRGHGVDGTHDGVRVHNLLASYAHLRTAAGGHWAPRFVAQVRRERRAAARHFHPAAELTPCSS